jgi:hypothetical protein
LENVSRVEIEVGSGRKRNDKVLGDERENARGRVRKPFALNLICVISTLILY